MLLTLIYWPRLSSLLLTAGQQGLCAKDHQTSGGQDSGQCAQADSLCHAFFSGSSSNMLTVQSKLYRGYLAAAILHILLAACQMMSC